MEQERQHTEQEVPSILEKRTILPGDKVLWVIVVMFLFISLVVVYSSTAKMAFAESTTGVFLRKHLISIGASICILLLFYLVNIKFVRILTPVAYLLSFGCTLAAYFTGGELNDAARWLDVGFFSFQPSELLKLSTVVTLALVLSNRQKRIAKVHLLPTTIDVRRWVKSPEREIFLTELIPIVLPIAAACAVILPAHTSSALHLFIISMVMLWISGIRGREVGKLVVVAAALGMLIMFAFGRGDTVTSRVKEWVRPVVEMVRGDGDEGADKRVVRREYKGQERSRMAINNGGLLGVGAGRSVMRARLTHPESDYLFSIIVEEFGLLISVFVILLYVWVFIRAMRIFSMSDYLYPGLIVVGLALLMTSQAFIHIAVTLGILPETGQNLPFLTQGRTSMFTTAIIMGVILSISRQLERGTLLPPSSSEESKRLL